MNEARGLSSVAKCLPGLLVVAGCASAWYVPTGATYPARATDCEIQVFSTDLPDRDYEEIGILEGEGSLWKADMGDLLPKLKEQACLAGGDAIILNTSQRYAEGEQGTSKMYASATVIRWGGE